MKFKLMEIGMAAEASHHISHCLTETSLYGVDTHGIRLFSYYLLELQKGRAVVNPKMKYEENTLVSGVLDAGNANGIVAGICAMEHAINKAKTTGVGIVVVKNSNHFGAASNFTRLAAKQKYIGVCMSNSDALVALQGGTEPFLGTNPIAVSVPGRNDNIFDLDFSTSQVSYSKAKSYVDKGLPLPHGWAIDDEGNDCALGNKINALQPLGGYKGQGLGFMVQMFTSVLSGMPFDHQLSHLYDEPYDTPRQVSHFFMAINPELFMKFNIFSARVEELLTEAENHTPKVVLPGKKELKVYRERKKSGIPLNQVEFKFFNLLKNDQANAQ